MRNLGLKAASVMVALLLAFFVNSETNQSEISFFVPIEVTNIPRDKIIIWPLTRQAQVTVSGPSFIASRVASSPPSFRVRVPADVESSYSTALQRRDLSLPPSVQLKNILPSEIELIFDNLVTKTVPVEVPMIGSVPEGINLDEVVISPAEVTVSGPETELQAISVVQGFPIDLKEIRESTRKEISIRVPGKLTESSVVSVTAEVRVSPIQIERKIENIPVELRARNQRAYKIRPLNIDVTVSGPQNLVERLEPRQILPFVRLRGDMEAGQKVDVEVELPRGVTLLNVQPSRITVVEVE